MRFGVDDYLDFIPHALTLFKTFLASTVIMLANVGLDPTVIVLRGPYIVVMGLIVTRMSNVIQSLMQRRSHQHGRQLWT
jgi:hypothetical protein